MRSGRSPEAISPVEGTPSLAQLVRRWRRIGRRDVRSDGTAPVWRSPAKLHGNADALVAAEESLSIETLPRHLEVQPALWRALKDDGGHFTGAVLAA